MTLTIECSGPQAARIVAVCEAAGVEVGKTVLRYGYTHNRTRCTVTLPMECADAMVRALRLVAAHITLSGRAGAGAWESTAVLVEGRIKEARAA